LSLGRVWLILGVDAEAEPIEDALERMARARVLAGEVDDFLVCLDELAELEFADHPNASLLVGRLMQRSHRLPGRAVLLATQARTAFAVAGDGEGLRLTDVLLGDLAWQRGEVLAADAHWSSAMERAEIGSPAGGLLTLRAAADYLAAGDTDRTIPRAHEAYAATLVDRSEADEALATLFAGLVVLDTGDLERASDALQRADELFRELESEEEMGMWPIVPIGLGEIAARRGDATAARSHFARSEQMATRLSRPALLVAARAMPMIHLTVLDPAPSIEMAESLVEHAESTQVHWFARQLADRGLVEVYLAAGRHDLAAAQAARCLERAGNPLLRAKCQLLAGRIDLKRGEHGAAAATLSEAVGVFLSLGASLCAVEALLILTEADPPRAAEYLGLAFDHTSPELAFARQWEGRSPLVVTVGPDAEVSFELAGETLRLGNKGERLLAEIVRTGPTGLHWEQAAAALWPDEADTDRIKSRLTSLTGLVRGRLGPEGWRLRRDGPLFIFVPYGAEVRSVPI
jgi:tetratricopeptide (TPR) repeat protein